MSNRQHRSMLAPATVLEALEHTLAANLEALHERIRIPSIPTDTHGADGGMWRADHPSTMVSTRGMRKLAFSLRGAANTLHSGRHGSGLANPLHAIARLITSQHQPDGRVALEGMVVHPGNALSADTNGGVVIPSGRLAEVLLALPHVIARDQAT